MLIKIFANRNYKKEYFGNEGTQNENRVTILTFEFPEELNEYNKRIVFLTPDGNKEDLIVDDSYIITNGIAKYEEVQAYVWLTNEKNQDFRSRLFNLKFYYNEQSDETEPTEEELDIYNTLITELNKAINRVAEIEIDVGTMAELKERVDVIDVKIVNLEEWIDAINTKFDELGVDIETIDNKVDEVRVLAENNSSEINNVSQELEGVDLEIERLSGNVNNIASDVARIDEKVDGIATSVETNKAEIRELEENQNYLEENKADKTEIPDVSEFIKNTVDNLINYYKKSETYTQAEVNQLIGAIKTAHFEVVERLPEIGENNIIYLVPKTIAKENDIYEEYIYVNEFYEFIGSTAVDLTGYATENWVNNQGFLKEHQSLKDYALKIELPTKTSDLDNDSNFINQTQMEDYIDSLNAEEVLY